MWDSFALKFRIMVLVILRWVFGIMRVPTANVKTASDKTVSGRDARSETGLGIPMTVVIVLSIVTAIAYVTKVRTAAGMWSFVSSILGMFSKYETMDIVTQ